MNTIYVDTYYLVVNMWSNWNWSKEYTPFGPTDNHLDQSKSNGPSDLIQGIHWPGEKAPLVWTCGMLQWCSQDSLWHTGWWKVWASEAQDDMEAADRVGFFLLC